MHELVLREQKMGNNIIPAMTYSVAEIKKMIAPNATDPELQMFCQLAMANNLDPFKREIYFIKYGETRPSYVTGYQVYLARAAMSGDLDGWEISVHESGGRPVSATITIYRKSMQKPVIWTVLAAEFDKGQANWKSMPAFMLQKVAIGQGFRLAFPEYLGGMPYLAEEITSTTEGADGPVMPPSTPAGGRKGKAQSTRKIEPKEQDVTKDVEIEPEENNEEGDAQEPEETKPPPRPAEVAAPAPDVLDPDVVEKVIQHFSKLGITEEHLEAVLECSKEHWTESHRLYLQNIWHKLTEPDATKKLAVKDFVNMRYSSFPS